MRCTERKRWHAETSGEVVAFWGSDFERGLSDAIAKERLAEVGENQLAETAPPSLLERIIGQLRELPVLTLLVVAVIAGVAGLFHTEAGALERWGDSIAILLIVVLNTYLGLTQEARAERSLAALRKMTAPLARVMRSGVLGEKPASALVPGDLVLLEEGDKIPADLRLLRTFDLDVVEAALTGESFPVTKDAAAKLPEEAPLAERVNMAFMGTYVSRGRGRALVVNTGMHTEIGQIAGLLAQMGEQETPLQKDMHQFGRAVVIGCLAVSAVVFGVGLIHGQQSWLELLMVAACLAVAAIPEGLPAITTIVLALGTERMARRNAIVRRLPAVEGLGCAQIICTDKTGTLTQNIMAVRRFYVDRTETVVENLGATPAPALRAALRIAAYATGAKLSRDETGWQAMGDPTDGALLVFAAKAGVQAKLDHLLHDAPFTSARRMASVLVRDDGHELGLVRGAPEVLLGRSIALWEGATPRPITESDRERLLEVAASWGRQAMRVIALAVSAGSSKDLEQELVFVGMVGIVDPPRPEVREAISQAQAAGIRSMMVTGDHQETALAIARELGLWEKDAVCLTGPQLDTIDQQALEEMVHRVRVVARATAAHKLRIVDALKARGIVCAMTGDGVNDAPAVKAASIGVAMGKTGTEVTKEASDLVIADDNYSTIVAAVEQGRAIYANIRKFIFFLLSSNASIVLVVFVAGLLGWPPTLAPIQILWINLITNGLPALALGVESPELGLMALPPRDSKAGIFTLREWIWMGVVGAVMALATLFAFHTVMTRSGSLALACTAAFTILSLSPMFHAFNCRSARVSNFRLGWASNRFLMGAVGIGVLLQALAIYVGFLQPVFKTAPLGGTDVLWIVGLSAIPLLLGEAYKLLSSSTSSSMK